MNKRQRVSHKITRPGKEDLVVEEEWDEEEEEGVGGSVLEINEVESECIPFDKATNMSSDCAGVCQGCELEFGPRSVGMLKKVWSTFEQNRELPIERLSKLISDAFEQLIVVPSIESGGEIIDSWNPRSVEIHLSYHMVDERLMTLTSLKTLRSLESSLKDRIHRKDGEIDHRAVMSLLNCQKQSLSLLHKLSDI